MAQRRTKSSAERGEFRTVRDAKGNEEFVLVPSSIFSVIRPRLNALLEDPFYRRLMSAPLDDEDETEDEIRAVRRARRARTRGELVPHEEVSSRSSR